MTTIMNIFTHFLILYVLLDGGERETELQLTELFLTPVAS